MTDHHSSVWDEDDDLRRAEANRYRCTAVDIGRRCQLVSDARHDDWPHIHTRFEWLSRSRWTIRCWQWQNGDAGRLIERPVTGPLPPWAACLRT